MSLVARLSADPGLLNNLSAKPTLVHLVRIPVSAIAPGRWHGGWRACGCYPVRQHHPTPTTHILRPERRTPVAAANG